MKSWKPVVLSVTAVIVLAGVIYLVGVEETLAAVGEAGVPAFAGLGLLQFLVILLQAVVWAILNRTVGHRIPFHVLVEAAAVGQAVNIVTPSAYLGGEPAKVYFVGRRTGLPYHTVAGTVVLAKYLEAMSFVLLFGVATCAAVYTFRGDLFTSSALPFGILLLVFATLLAGLCVVLWISLVMHWRPLTRIVRWIQRLRPRSTRLDLLRERALSMEEQIDRVFREERRSALGAFALYFLSHALVLVRPLLFFALGSGLGLGFGDLALLFVAGQALLSIQVTPSGMGTFDGGLLGVFSLMGIAAPQCMAFLLAIRLWDAVTVGAGVLLGVQFGATLGGPQAGKAPGGLQR